MFSKKILSEQQYHPLGLQKKDQEEINPPEKVRIDRILLKKRRGPLSHPDQRQKSKQEEPSEDNWLKPGK